MASVETDDYGENQNRSIFTRNDEEGKSFNIYPYWAVADEEESYQKFSSVILNEEIEGFNHVASHYTDDILTTLAALNASRIDPVEI